MPKDKKDIKSQLKEMGEIGMYVGSPLAAGLGARATIRRSPNWAKRLGEILTSSQEAAFAKDPGTIADELVRKHVPESIERSVSNAPHLLSKPDKGVVGIAYGKNPYSTAHEIGHIQDPKMLERFYKAKELIRSEGKTLKAGVTRTIPELIANWKGFNLIRKELGLKEALKGLPTFAGSSLSYLGGYTPKRVAKMVANVGGVGAGLGALGLLANYYGMPDFLKSDSDS